MAKAKNRLYPVRGDGGAVLRRTGVEEGELMEQMGVWRREYDSTNGRLRGYRVVGTDADRGDEDLRVRRFAVAIDAAQMQINCERSRTRGLGERMRAEREANGRPAEDVVERVQAKVRIWPLIGAARGDVLRAWPARA